MSEVKPTDRQPSFYLFDLAGRKSFKFMVGDTYLESLMVMMLQTRSVKNLPPSAVAECCVAKTNAFSSTDLTIKLKGIILI